MLYEHHVLSMVLQYAIEIDRLNAKNSVALELVVRRLQLIESAYEVSKDGKSPDFFHAEEMMGTLQRPSGAVISGTLEKESGERLSQRAEIEKQLKKAKEAMRPAKTNQDGQATGKDGKH